MTPEEITLTLLTGTEIDWLLGKRQLSKAYERKLRHDIKEKLRILSQVELPLLESKGFSVTASSNSVTISG